LNHYLLPAGSFLQHPYPQNADANDRKIDNSFSFKNPRDQHFGKNCYDL